MKMHLSLYMVTAGMILLPFANVSGQDNELIRLTQVPEWGNTTSLLHGRVDANPQDYKVTGVIFIQEAGGWWTKPSFDNPAVPIAADSTFSLDFVSGGLDQYCTRLLAVLVPENYQVPLFSGAGDLPPDLLEHPYAIAFRPHGDRKLDWAGFPWTVRRTIDDYAINPGPNLFSSDEDNVFVDNESGLHLRITNPSGQWLCSELIADTSLGFGTYTFNLQSRVDLLDIHTVLGIFTWDDIAPYDPASPESYFREYDIEFGRWSIPGNDEGQFVIQPWDAPGNIFRFPIGPESHTIHRWTWKKDTIAFVSMREDSSLLAQFEYTGDYYKDPGRENVRINLWLNFGQAPSGPQEAILSGFAFENLLPAPENVAATDGDTLKVTITWDAQLGKFFGVYRGISDDPLQAVLLNGEWITQATYTDDFALAGQTYYYWVRSSDNLHGSNTTGYASGFSDPDTGWAASSATFISGHGINDDLRISPNPCDDYVRISLAAGRKGLLQLYGQGGRLILQRPIHTDMLIETGSFAPGIYLLQLIQENGSTCIKKLLVTHQ